MKIHKTLNRVLSKGIWSGGRYTDSRVKARHVKELADWFKRHPELFEKNNVKFRNIRIIHGVVTSKLHRRGFEVQTIMEIWA